MTLRGPREANRSCCLCKVRKSCGSNANLQFAWGGLAGKLGRQHLGVWFGLPHVGCGTSPAAAGHGASRRPPGRSRPRCTLGGWKWRTCEQRRSISLLLVVKIDRGLTITLMKLGANVRNADFVRGLKGVPLPQTIATQSRKPSFPQLSSQSSNEHLRSSTATFRQ